jgi:hypothetical protein
MYMDPLGCQRENGMWNNKEWNVLGKTAVALTSYRKNRVVWTLIVMLLSLPPFPPDCIKCHTFLNSKHLDSSWVVDAAYFHGGWVTNCLCLSIHILYIQQCSRKVQVYRYDGETFLWLLLFLFLTLNVERCKRGTWGFLWESEQLIHILTIPYTFY